jgi:hypothetical protein|tara:strand:- start:1608 stop:2231 length:624 start_codon:yes stop_codon:yes gene_type:complete
MKSLIRLMTQEILLIAELKELCNAEDLYKRLLLHITNNKQSYGGKQYGMPIMQIGNFAWQYTPGQAEEKLTEWQNVLRVGGNKTVATREIIRWKKALSGIAVVNEYPRIWQDPEIGDLEGDVSDKLKPLAWLLSHELAHVIDYNCGATGGGHGKRWQRIYRIIRNAFVNNGRYQMFDTQQVIQFPKKQKKELRMDLLGLPLFDLQVA